MFQKPAFGSTNTSSFGSFNAGTSASSPFSGFKPAAGASAFGAPPAFGAAAAPQPAAGGGLFGSSNTSGGLFGNNAASTSAPAFGAPSGGFGFGASTSAGGGLFGSNTSTGLFGNAQNNSAFGAKPAGFGFGGTATAAPASGGLFGSTPSTGTGLFGQQNNSMSGGGLFNNTSSFGQQQTAPGTGHVKYNPVVGTDVVVKSGASQNINIKHHCITCMKEYETKSLEELRLEDYTAGRKGSAGGMFGGGFTTQVQENKPLFGGSTAFGQPAATTASSVFGAPALGASAGFGQTSTFSFGGGAAAGGAGLFGAAKPAFGAAPAPSSGLFGATTTQAPTFGTNTSSAFGFGANTQSQPAGGLFGAKPATSGFGAAPSSGFGAFGGGALFQAKPPQAAPAFGAAAPAFGASLPGSFGATAPTGGLFANTFGKPAATQPTFSFNTQPALGTGGLGALGGAQGAFAQKPGAPAFGLGGGMFPQAQPFRTGLETGLGGGMFGNNSSLGGLGLNANNSSLANNSLAGAGAGAGADYHSAILALAARPYGDQPLFKHLLPDTSTTAEDVLKPTNPAAVKAVLDGSGYRVTSPGTRLKLQPRAALPTDKKSLFDGLEESDASLEDKLSLKPSRKRLVLRPDQAPNPEQHNHNNRSLEEPPPQPQVNGSQTETEKDVTDARVTSDNVERAKRAVSFNENNADDSADKNGSWLSGSKVSWSDKEKPIEEPTPRLYPNLDKEVTNQTSERRASWLTTKPLRKPLASQQDSAENSVRELCVRSPPSAEKQNQDSLSCPTAEALRFCRHRGGARRRCSCEKIAHQIQGVYVSEEENVPPRDMPPHPSGVKLTRPGYYTIPSLDELIAYMRPDGSCVVPHFTVGRHNYGNVFYECEVDVAGLDLDKLVHFLNKEVIIYPEDADKPPVGAGLNRRAVVTLDRVWPRDKTQKRPITDPDRLLLMEYESKLRRVCDKHDTKFIEYRPQTGSWVFRVEHFSKYGLTDSDEEDDGPTPEVLKRQLVVKEAVQKAAAIAAPKPTAVQSPGLGGLGGLGSLTGLSGLSGLVDLPASEDTLLAMHQTSLNLLNGAGKAFEMDTTEDNTESQSLYQDNRVLCVKSPTSELARLEHRASHTHQLMKASLYADTDMEDDMSVSTGDQLVPTSGSALQPPPPPSSRPAGDLDAVDETPITIIEEHPMKPLLVRPHTIVLKYHRKVPPFKQTIAGRLGAAYLADMSVCRARHSRVGFGPKATLAYVTSYDSVSDLPKNAELCDLSKYVRGRLSDDWSEAVVARVAVAEGDSTSYLQEALSRHLETLLEYSEISPCEEGQCPQLRVKSGPRERRDLLNKHLRDARRLSASGERFGVSSAYCYEVWRLCDALWGADLDNDGIPGKDVASIVHRHRRLLEWMRDAVADATDRDLAKPRQGEPEDEEDGHSARVWTLLVGGRILEACKLCREHGDLNMAVLIAQAAGDPKFRSLVSRQLSQWRACGADTAIGRHRLASLRLLAGERDMLHSVDWLRALHATARYLCPQVPTLERVIRTYEGFFSTGAGEEKVDLSTVEADEMGMSVPLPPYMEQYDIRESESSRRVLDVRYELLRARAHHERPRLRPASYSPDPLDYSLCFLLGTWFGHATADSITGVADQLEACGLWHLAVQALAYHPDHVVRGHLIRGVLSRHAPATADTAERTRRLQLVARLRVPAEWVLLARAHRAKYEHLPGIEADHLVNAGQYNAAHRVLLEELQTQAVLGDDLKSIAPLLEKLNEAAQRQQVSGWEAGGQALYHYLHVLDEIRGLVSLASSGPLASPRAAVPARLEALRPRVAAACRALRHLRPTTARHCAARAEMGARLVQLALAAGEPPHHLAALLRALRLPHDCTANAHYKITTDLAEQASESCIESATSSPLSSHHRAAIQS